MPSRRISIRYGAHKDPKSISLTALRMIGDNLLAALRAQARDPGLEDVNLVELKHGSRWTVWEAQTKLGSQAIRDIAFDLGRVSRGAASRLDPQAAGALHALLTGISGLSGDAPVRVRGEGLRGARWLEMDRDVRVRLEHRLRAGPEHAGERALVVVGDLYEINRQTKTFKVKVRRLGYRTFEYRESEWLQVEAVQWGRVTVKGFPSPTHQGRYRMSSIESAGAGSEQLVTIDEDPRAKEAFLAPLAKLRADPALQRRGWDSYHAAPLDLDAVDRASTSLLALRAQLALMHLVLPPPFAAPIPSGGVQVEWETEGRYLEFEYTAKGATQYLLEDASGTHAGAAEEDAALLALRRYLERGR